MQTTDFDFTYPEELVATHPAPQPRIAYFNRAQNALKEITKNELFDLFSPGDAIVINDTQVLPRRITSSSGLEILFLDEIEPSVWTVLFPAKQIKDNESIALPGGVSAQLVARGLPQIIRVSEKISADYFEQFGELALPPYIQSARHQRKNLLEDKLWYQTAWAKVPGSSAAPTASLHFSKTDLESLKKRGVNLIELTLHVGLGTFLPVKTKNLLDHKMHAEKIYLPKLSADLLQSTQRSGRKIWALGTTATRAVESYGQNLLKFNEYSNCFEGNSDLFITPGYEFKFVNALLTNFHQPQSTLLALVSAFAGRERVLKTYQWAIENQFRLFSYGDLSVWE